MSKIIIRSKLTNEIIELEGKINIIPDNWEIVSEGKQNNKKNGSPKQKANGDGSFYYSDTLGKWIGQYGRKTITQRKNESKTDCKRRWENLKSQMKNGTYIEKNKDTLYSILDRHIKQKYKDGTTSPRSYKRNSETLAQIKETCKNFIDRPISKVTIEDIEDAKIKIRKYSPNTISKIWCMLKAGFRIAASRRKILFNIMDDPDLNKPISLKEVKPKEALTKSEEEKLRNILNNEEKEHPYSNIVLLQLNTGMRIGETLARNIDDFNEKDGTLYIWNTLTRSEKDKVIMGEHTKIYNKKTQIDKGKRTIPLDIEARKILLNIKKSSLKNIMNLFFWDYSKNTFITDGEINSWLSRLNSKYKITEKRLSTHVLRHTKITRLQEAGVPLVVIQYIVGHIEGSKVTNDVYTTVSLDFAIDALTKAEII